MALPLVVAEIGGSSSRWALLGADGNDTMFPERGEAIAGFNPLNGDRDLFTASIRSYFRSGSPDVLDASQVMVYGAGCGSDRRKEDMRAAIRTIWAGASIEVETDLVGTARGLCGSDTGLVLILGTGMNVGWYDGARLFHPMPSLGYVLGDEGSGADIGRTLLQDAFYRRMPEHVRSQLFGPDGPVVEAVLDEVYRAPFPAKTLAARTASLSELLHDPYVRDLVQSRFHALVETLLPFFPSEQRGRVFATGSVAYGFRELLAGCLADRGMDLTVVEKDPLPGLVAWHRSPS